MNEERPANIFDETARQESACGKAIFTLTDSLPGTLQPVLFSNDMLKGAHEFGDFGGTHGALETRAC